MAPEKEWGTLVKVFLYLFDIVSDIVNGVLLTMKEGTTSNTTTITLTVSGQDPDVWKNDSFILINTGKGPLSTKVVFIRFI